MTFENIIQAKIDALDSNNTVIELLELMHLASKYNQKSVYDSAGVMPTDSASEGNLLYSEKDQMLLFNNGAEYIIFDSDAAAPPPPTANALLNGTLYGYTVGSAYDTSEIQKFPFANNANATNVGRLLPNPSTNTTYNASSVTASETHGYLIGGYDGTPGVRVSINVIQKWTFASDADASDVGDATAIISHQHASQSDTHGYSAGGDNLSPTYTPNTGTLLIEKYPYAADANSTTVGNLVSLNPSLSTQGIYGGGGGSSPTHGYSFGGYARTDPGTFVIGTPSIQKYPFAADEDAAVIGDLNTGTSNFCAVQSTESIYQLGGFGYPTYPSYLNTIEKFSITSDAPGASVGTLDKYRSGGHPSSSTSDGYHSGGTSSPVAAPPHAYNDDIIKMSFASDTSVTDIGYNLSIAPSHQQTGGTQT